MHPNYLASLFVCVARACQAGREYVKTVSHSSAGAGNSHNPFPDASDHAGVGGERNASRLELLLDNFSICKMHAFLYF